MTQKKAATHHKKKADADAPADEAGASAPEPGKSPNKVPAGSSITVERQKELARKAAGLGPGHRQAKRAQQRRTRKFLLKRGQHFDAKTGDVTEKGGTVESDQPLDQMEPDRYAPAREDADDATGTVHSTGGGEDPTHADRVINQFPRDGVAEEEKDETPAEGEGEEGAKDVTEKFPAAESADVKVFKVDGGYNVVDADDIETPLQGDKPLENPAAVRKFLRKKYGG